MRNIFKLLSITAFVLVITFAVTACSGGSGNSGPYTPPPPPPPTPLTGTVTVTDAVTVSIVETKTLTANVSGLNGTDSYSYSYQWIRDGADISGARSSTYNVTSADYGKTLRVKVTYSGYSGEQFGEIAVGTPTILALTLKRDAINWGQDTGITIERTNGDYWGSVSTGSGAFGSLSTTGATITLTSWSETQFKMRTTYTFIETKFYFKKDNASGSDTFELTTGTRTYILENISSMSSLTGVYAKEQS